MARKGKRKCVRGQERDRRKKEKGEKGKRKRERGEKGFSAVCSLYWSLLWKRSTTKFVTVAAKTELETSSHVFTREPERHQLCTGAKFRNYSKRIAHGRLKLSAQLNKTETKPFCFSFIQLCRQFQVNFATRKPELVANDELKVCDIC